MKKQHLKITVTLVILLVLVSSIIYLLGNQFNLLKEKYSSATNSAVRSALLFKNDLYFGLKNNEEVKELQKFLAYKGYFSGPITGNFFASTQSAVEELQTDNNIISDTIGNVGIETREVLNEMFVNEKEAALLSESIDDDYYFCDELDSPPSSTQSIKEKFLASLTLQQCRDNPPALPTNCVVYEGSAMDNFLARWLWCWKNNGYPNPIVGSLASLGVSAGCDLSAGQIRDILDACNLEEATERKIECAKVSVTSGLFAIGGSTCKHHARCLKKVLEDMGIEQTYVARFFPTAGHAWNQVDSPNGTYYIDSYNSIHFWCPR